MNKLRSNRYQLSLGLLALFIWLILPLAADEGRWPYTLIPKIIWPKNIIQSDA
jgi:hypothetical protein